MSTAVSVVRSAGHVYPEHEEVPTRFDLLGEGSKSLEKCLIIAPEMAERAQVLAVHTEGMLARLEQTCRRGPVVTDYAPSYVTKTSYEDALLAAGATVACTRAVLEGRAQDGFAIVRPPGHHAEADVAMGYCLLNNVAIAARFALQSGVGKVLVVDFDAHHGNGTQAAFLDEARVAFFSTQQEGIYPFRSGFLEDAPQARGRIVNLPLPERSGEACFEQIAAEVLTPLVEKTRPEMILVSAGFDSHWDDPLAELGLTSTGYYAYARCLKELAEVTCGGRVVFVLEGGYNPVNVATGVEAVLCALAGEAYQGRDPSPYAEPEIGERLRWVRAAHGLR